MSVLRPLLSYLLVACVWLAGAGLVEACQYCEAAAYPREPLTGRNPATTYGDFPLDRAIGQIAPADPTAPPPGSAITNTPAGKARAAAILAAAGGAPVAHATKAGGFDGATVVASAAAPVVPRTAARLPSRVADVGLLGLAAAGGVFCWRTRRKPSATPE